MVTIITGIFTQTGAIIHKNGNTQAKIAMVFCVVYCKKKIPEPVLPPRWLRCKNGLKL